MVGKGKWVVLLCLVAQNLPGLRLSPPVVKKESDCCPRWLGEYSYYKINCSTLTIIELLSIQYR